VCIHAVLPFLVLLESYSVLPSFVLFLLSSGKKQGRKEGRKMKEGRKERIKEGAAVAVAAK
jgi:hypothetical protein